MQNFKLFLKESDLTLPFSADLPEYLNKLIDRIHNKNIMNMHLIGLFDDNGRVDIDLVLEVIAERDITLFDENIGEGFSDRFINIVSSWEVNRNTHELWASVSFTIADFQMAIVSITILRYCHFAVNSEQDNTQKELHAINSISRAQTLLGYFEQLRSMFHLCLYFDKKYESKYKSNKLSIKAKREFTNDITGLVRAENVSADKMVTKIGELYEERNNSEIVEWVENTLSDKKRSEIKRDIIEPIKASLLLFK